MKNDMNLNMRCPGLWSVEFDGHGEMTKVTWSQVFRELLGFCDTQDFPNVLESWTARMHPQDKPAILKAYWAAIEGTQNYDVEYRMMNKEGKYKWFRNTGEVERREDGSPSLFIGILMDITEKKEELREAKNEVEIQNDVFRSLCSDYVGIYRVDFATDRCEQAQNIDKLQAGVRENIKFEDGYQKAMEKYIALHVVDKDKEYVRAMTEKSYVLNQLKIRKKYSIRYQVKENSQQVENFEIHFVGTGKKEEENIVIFGFRNVDNIVQKEEEFKLETKRDIEEILEVSRTGIWTIELEDGCEPRMYAGRAMRMLLGIEEDITPEECYKRWFDNIEAEYVDMVQEAVQEILRTGRAEVMYPWNHPTQGKIYIRCGGVHDENFEKAGVCLKGYHQDITETMVTRQKQDKAIMEALNEAKRANQAKSEFLSHMSHDIRTPINGILGMLTISEKNQDDLERQKECRKKIRISAEHLLSLINDVLDISKLESGTFSLAQNQFDICDVLENCMTILRPQAEEQGIYMEENRKNLQHTRLIGSPLHLRQILINIIGNAIKYNRPNGQIFVCTEELSSKKGFAEYRFVIEDTGIGMGEEFKKHLFEPFTQESKDARTSFKGAGLGMAITKKLVDKMGGTIEVESELEKGSIFKVTLLIPIDETQEERSVQQEEDAPADVSGMKVLLVEDNAINCEIVQYMLEDAKATVVTAENGKEAVDIFAASKIGAFDCILMDVMMPVMNGLDATRAIRSLNRPDAETVPIIALSANAFEEDVKKAKEAGMNQHLTKPVNMDKMFRVMWQLRNKK